MRLNGRVVLAVLIYVVLDLSLASMPGAFVFDAGGSVETVQRSRTGDPNVSVRTLIRDPRGAVSGEQATRTPHVVHVDLPATSWIPLRTGAERPNAAPELAPPSEESH